MVEVQLVAVEASDGDRYVPAALIVLLGVGVQHPLVDRCRDGHRSGLAQEVHVELGRSLGVFGVGGRHQADGQPLVVEALSGAHLQLQLGGHARHERHAHAAAGQRLSVHAQLGTVGVRLVHGEQREDAQSAGGLGLLALVGYKDGKARRVVHRYTAHALLVKADGRVVHLQRALVEDGAGLVEARLALVLPRVGGDTAACAEHEARRVTVLRHVALTPQIVQGLLGDVLEVVVAIHILRQPLAALGSDVGHRHAIYIHAQTARRSSGDGERFRAVILVRQAAGADGLRRQHGRQRPAEVFAVKLEGRLLILHSTTHLRVELLKRLYIAEDRTADIVGNGRGYRRDGAGALAAEVVGLHTVGEVHRRSVRVAAAERLAVVHTLCTGDVVAVHQFGGVQFLALVLRNHLRPGVDDFALVRHLVVEVAHLFARGQHDDVVRRVVGRLNGRVILLVGQRKLRVGRLAQRAVDRLVRRVGQYLCIGLAADEHVVHDFASQVRDDLLQNLLLRIDEVRLQLRAVAERHVAHQVELLAVGIHTVGNVDQRAVLGILCHVALRVRLADARLGQP